MNKEKQIAIRAVDGQYSVRRDELNGWVYVDFYASVFNQQSKLISEWGERFYEIISPFAFQNVLKDPGLNTIATIDHDRAKMIGRVKSGTLAMVTDSKGLKCTVQIPDTQLGRDIVVLIERGDYFECSFIYTIAEGGVSYDNSGPIPVRTVLNIAQLIDVSIVIDGAFSDTEIKKRYNLPDFETQEQNQNQNSPSDILKRLQNQIEVLKLKKI